MLYKLRTSNRGKYQTKIRSGNRDFILKYKVKGDDTPWSQVPSLSIPEEAPGAEIHLMKESKNQRQPTKEQPENTEIPTNWNISQVHNISNEQQTNTPQSPTNRNIDNGTQQAIETITNSSPMETMDSPNQMDLQGTISGQLKHKLSPIENIVKKTKITPTTVNTDNEDEDEQPNFNIELPSQMQPTSPSTQKNLQKISKNITVKKIPTTTTQKINH